jgi:hypothetical protein
MFCFDGVDAQLVNRIVGVMHGLTIKQTHGFVIE